MSTGLLKRLRADYQFLKNMLIHEERSRTFTLRVIPPPSKPAKIPPYHTTMRGTV